MSDVVASTIDPKTDQLNGDSLLNGPITVTITRATKSRTPEQPVTINYEGDAGRPYKPCKIMRRLMVHVWGPAGEDGEKYVGRRMTLYRDPTVKWGADEVGGIRISHMSDIREPVTLSLTMTKGNKKPVTVKPLAAIKPEPRRVSAAPVLDDAIDDRIEDGATSDMADALEHALDGCETREAALAVYNAAIGDKDAWAAFKSTDPTRAQTIIDRVRGWGKTRAAETEEA